MEVDFPDSDDSDDESTESSDPESSDDSDSESKKNPKKKSKGNATPEPQGPTKLWNKITKANQFTNSQTDDFVIPGLSISNSASSASSPHQAGAISSHPRNSISRHGAGGAVSKEKDPDDLECLDDLDDLDDLDSDDPDTDEPICDPTDSDYQAECDTDKSTSGSKKLGKGKEHRNSFESGEAKQNEQQNTVTDSGSQIKNRIKQAEQSDSSNDELDETPDPASDSDEDDQDSDDPDSDEDPDSNEDDEDDEETDLLNYVHLLKIQTLLGPIPRSIFDEKPKYSRYYTENGLLNYIHPSCIQKRDLETILMEDHQFSKTKATEIRQFIRQMIDWNPNQRKKADELLTNKWLQLQKNNDPTNPPASTSSNSPAPSSPKKGAKVPPASRKAPKSANKK
jgi:hypothetical protein